MTVNDTVIREFRDNNGAVGGAFAGAHLILLTTQGRKTTKPHTTPTIYRRDGSRYLVFASNAGEPDNPDWYENLVAHPQVTFEIGTDEGAVKSFAAVAAPLEGDERERYWELQCDAVPVFRDYQEKAGRLIPVVALSPLDLAGGAEVMKAVGERLILGHDSLRADLARIRLKIQSLLAAEPDGETAPAASLVDELRQHCLTYCYGLHTHHIREDGAYSTLEKGFPHLVPAFARLRREHRVVETMLNEFEATLSQNATGDRADVEWLRTELDRTVAGLEEHFAYEEEHLLPALGVTRSS